MSSNKTIKEVLLDSNLFSSDEIDNLLDIEKQKLKIQIQQRSLI